MLCAARLSRVVVPGAAVASLFAVIAAAASDAVRMPAVALEERDARAAFIIAGTLAFDVLLPLFPVLVEHRGNS